MVDDIPSRDSPPYRTGDHVVIDLVGVDPEPDADTIMLALRSISTTCKTKILNCIFHDFEPHGQTGLCLLSTSHMSFHTWPEHKHVSFDFFSCGEVSPEIAVDTLNEIFHPKKISVHLISRGVDSKVIKSYVLPSENN